MKKSVNVKEVVKLPIIANKTGINNPKRNTPNDSMTI